MKKLFVIFLLLSSVAEASSLNSSLELVYVYGIFITVVLLIVGIDKGVKYIYQRLKERSESLENSLNTFDTHSIDE
ncbi:MAG: hypothetical protein WCO54_10100 [Bacteroidota bacterium]